MAPPADFSFGPEGADEAATNALRGPLCSVQFPVMALDILIAAVPDMGWAPVCGEMGLSWGGCCILTSIAAWSTAKIEVSFKTHTFGLPVIARVLSALVELPLDWTPTVFSVLRERVRDYLRTASNEALWPFKVALEDLMEVEPDPSPEPGKPGALVPNGEKAAAHLRWCDLLSSNSFYDDLGCLELKCEPRVLAVCRGVIKDADSGHVMRELSAYSSTLKRLSEAAVRQEGVTISDGAIALGGAMGDVLQRTQPEPELTLALPPGRDSDAEWRARLAYGDKDPHRTAGIVKFMTNVMHHLPTLVLVFADKDGHTLPLGNAGTASAALAAHGDALGVAPRDHLTVGTLRELEGAWLPSTPTIEGVDYRLKSIAERLSSLRVLAVADRASVVAAASVGGLSIGGVASSGEAGKVRTLGVPAQYEAQRRAELASPRMVSLVAELKAINAAGGSDRAKNIVETALLGGKLLETSSFVYQMASGVFDSDAVAPEIAFLTADVASDLPRVVGRCVARALSRRRNTVPETLVDYADEVLTRELQGNDWSVVNWAQALARARAHKHVRANEVPRPEVVELWEQFASKEAIDRVTAIILSILPLFRYVGRPDELGAASVTRALGGAAPAGSVAGSKASASTGATAVEDLDPTDYYIGDALEDCAERYHEHGGNAERDAVLAVSVNKFLASAFRTMGVRAYKVSHAKNPQADNADQTIDQAALGIFRRDNEDLIRVNTMARSKAWSGILEGAAGAQNGTQAAAPASAAGEKRGRAAVAPVTKPPVAKAAAALDVDPAVAPELVHQGSVTSVTYKGIPAWRVDNGRGEFHFYSQTAEMEWFTAHNIDIATVDRKVLIGTGMVPWWVACTCPTTPGHTSARDLCHVQPNGYKPGLFRISSYDGSVGSRPRPDGGGAPGGGARGTGKGGRGAGKGGRGGGKGGKGGGKGTPPGPPPVQPLGVTVSLPLAVGTGGAVAPSSMIGGPQGPQQVRIAPSDFSLGLLCAPLARRPGAALARAPPLFTPPMRVYTAGVPSTGGAPSSPACRGEGTLSVHPFARSARGCDASAHGARAQS